MRGEGGHEWGSPPMWAASESDPTHDDETVMNGAPKMVLSSQDGFMGDPPADQFNFCSLGSAALGCSYAEK
jgi:hypothetical protein